MTTRPMLTQREAAAACGVSRSTIRRRREDGALPHAVFDEGRGWLIPVDDLLAAGFRVNAPAPPDAGLAGADTGHGQDQEHEGTAAEVERLRAELADARREAAEAEADRRVAVAEAEAAREVAAARAAHIADLQQALAALAPAPERPALHPPVPAVPAQPSTAPPGPAGADASAGEPRRRWWRR